MARTAPRVLSPARPGNDSDRGPRIRPPVLGRLRQGSRPKKVVRARAHRVDLVARDVTREHLARRPAQLVEQPREPVARHLVERLADVVPDDGAQLVLDVEADAVVDDPDASRPVLEETM